MKTWTDVIAFLRSKQPVETLDEATMRAILAIKPERMGSELEWRWGQARPEIVRRLEACDEERRHRELVAATASASGRSPEHTLMAWWKLAAWSERFGMVSVYCMIFLLGFLCAKVEFISRAIILIRDVIP